MEGIIIPGGTEVTADFLNYLGGLNSCTFTYDGDGNVDTVTDTITGIVFTFAYDDQGRADTVADGTNTWTFSYDSDDNVASIVRTP